MRFCILVSSLATTSIATASMLRGSKGAIEDAKSSRKLTEPMIQSDFSYSLKNELNMTLGVDGNTPFGRILEDGQSLTSEESSFKFFQRTCSHYLGAYECFLIQHEHTGQYLSAPDRDPYYRTELELVDTAEEDDPHVHWRVYPADHVACRTTTIPTECLLLYNVETINSVYALDNGNGNIEVGAGHSAVRDFILHEEIVWNFTPN